MKDQRAEAGVGDDQTRWPGNDLTEGYRLLQLRRVIDKMCGRQPERSNGHVALQHSNVGECDRAIEVRRSCPGVETRRQVKDLEIAVGIGGGLQITNCPDHDRRSGDRGARVVVPHPTGDAASARRCDEIEVHRCGASRLDTLSSIRVQQR